MKMKNLSYTVFFNKTIPIKGLLHVFRLSKPRKVKNFLLSPSIQLAFALNIIVLSIFLRNSGIFCYLFSARGLYSKHSEYLLILIKRHLYSYKVIGTALYYGWVGSWVRLSFF